MSINILIMFKKYVICFFVCVRIHAGKCGSSDAKCIIYLEAGNVHAIYFDIRKNIFRKRKASRILK